MQHAVQLLLLPISLGRHAAKHDPLAHQSWEQTANQRYTRADGVPYALPGAAQMIFSDLGTLAAEQTRGFSAYRWIRDSLVARGVPAHEIAFMQDFKKSSAKQRLFNAVNAGQVRILIGSRRVRI
jgi:hypothetical protein